MSRITQDRIQKSEVVFAYGAITVCGSAFQQILLTTSFVTFLSKLRYSSYNPKYIAIFGLAFCHFARRYFDNTCFSFFSSGYWEVSLPQVSAWNKSHAYRYNSIEVSLFGKSRIVACKRAPRNISFSYNVLHRHIEPRHPPYTLNTPIRKCEAILILILKSKLYLPYQLSRADKL
jgi:hypothetical protein